MAARRTAGWSLGSVARPASARRNSPDSAAATALRRAACWSALKIAPGAAGTRGSGHATDARRGCSGAARQHGQAQPPRRSLLAARTNVLTLAQARQAHRGHRVLVDEVLQAVALDHQGVAVEAPQDAGDALAGQR